MIYCLKIEKNSSTFQTAVSRYVIYINSFHGMNSIEVIESSALIPESLRLADSKFDV